MLATKEMAVYCLHVLYNTLAENRAIPSCPPSIPNENCPIFVTYKYTKNDDLRGCIGNFEPQPLHQQLREYAVVAALEDQRFKPMTLKDLPKITCTISLLHSFEPCASWDDWTVGTHGIRIKYRLHRATFLPCVAEEQGWNQEKTLQALLAKGRYKGEVTPEVLQQVEVTRYQVSTASATLADCPFME